MEDESIFINKQYKGISEGLQNFIDSMVEEIVLEGKPFDSQKKYLKKFSENEGLDYDKLEADITIFIKVLESLKTALDKLQVKLAEEKGKECHISEETIQKLVNHSSLSYQKRKEKTLIGKKNGSDRGNSLNKLYIIGGIGLMLLVVILQIFKRNSDNHYSGYDTNDVLKSDTVVIMHRDTFYRVQNTSEAERKERVDDECIEHKEKVVDLGLSSGLKWAIFNVGAESINDKGTIMKYDNDTKNLIQSEWESTNWRLPTSKDFMELFSCQWDWTEMTSSNGDSITGFTITGHNGNKMFLPYPNKKTSGNPDVIMHDYLLKSSLDEVTWIRLFYYYKEDKIDRMYIQDRDGVGFLRMVKE